MADIKKCSEVLAQFVAFQTDVENLFQNKIIAVFEERNATKRKRGRARKQNAPPSKKAAKKTAGTLPAPLTSIAEEREISPAANRSTSLRKTQRSAAKRATEITSLQLKQTLSEKLRNPGSIVTSKTSEKLPEREIADLPPCVVVLNRVSTPELKDISSNANHSINSSSTPRIGEGLKGPIKSPIRTSRSAVLKTKAKSIFETCEQHDDEVEDKSKRISEEVHQNNNHTNDDNLTQNEEKNEVPASLSNQGQTTAQNNCAELLEPTIEEPELSCFKVPAKPLEVPQKSQEIGAVEKNEFAPPAASRPKRTRTRNKKYCDEDYLSDSFQAKKATLSNCGDIVPKIIISEATINVSDGSESMKRGKKRKSQSMDLEVSKKADLGNTKTSDSGMKSSGSNTNNNSDIVDTCGMQLLSIQSSPLESLAPRSRTKTLAKPTVSNLMQVESSHEAEDTSAPLMNNSEVSKKADEERAQKSDSGMKSASSSSNTNSEKGETSSGIRSVTSPAESLGPRSRTKTLAKATVSNLDQLESPNETKQPSPTIKNTSPVISMPGTRTRTREMNKKAMLLQDKKPNPETKSAGKENYNAHLLKLLSSTEKRLKTTPLATNNTMFSPSYKGPKPFSSLKKVESGKKIETASLSKKEHAALLKKQEYMKSQMEIAKKKREEREQRQIKHKLALEKKEKERLAKLEKEKEEKDKQIANIKKMKEEQILQKKQMNEALLREAEERRIKEEEAKQARLKKQEEEKRKAAEGRAKQVEEAKKLHEMRLAEEAKEKEISMKEAEKNKKLKIKKKVQNCDSYQLTPSKDELPPKKPKNENDYGLSDVESGESTDEESRPKKIIPKWAAKTPRLTDAMVQSKIHSDLLSAFFPMTYDMNPIIKNNVRCRQRASSAVWDTPN